MSRDRVLCIERANVGLTTTPRDNDYNRCVFTERPLCGPLLFANNASDARDHCANERSAYRRCPVFRDPL